MAKANNGQRQGLSIWEAGRADKLHREEKGAAGKEASGEWKGNATQNATFWMEMTKKGLFFINYGKVFFVVFIGPLTTVSEVLNGTTAD